MLVLSFVSPLTQGIRKEFSQVYGLIRNKENIDEQKFFTSVGCLSRHSVIIKKTKQKKYALTAIVSRKKKDNTSLFNRHT